MQEKEIDIALEELNNEQKKLDKEIKKINSLLIKLENISAILLESSIDKTDKNIFSEFINRIYYKRDELKKNVNFIIKKIQKLQRDKMKSLENDLL